MTDNVQNLFFGGLLGIAAHLTVFIKGEWHLQAPNVVLVHAGLFFTVFMLEKLSIGIGYCVGVYASMVVYRICFHRLSKAGYPGPIALRVSKLWHVWKCRSSKNHLYLSKLNEQYGDFVRTGPSEVTVFDPAIFWIMDGPKSQCAKAEWYDFLHPNRSVVTTRDKSIHSIRRREWTRGFSPKTIGQYEKKIMPYIDQLEKNIQADAERGAISDVTTLMNWFSWDAMGQFVFNKSFNMLQDNQWHHIVFLLRKSLAILGPFSPVPWLIQVFFNLLPRVGALGDWFTMLAWCEQQMKIRVSESQNVNPNEEPDFVHYLMESASKGGYRKEDWDWLNGDSIFAVVAGSEPTSSTLVSIMYELTKHPEQIQKLKRELMMVDDIRDVRKLAECPHLDAVIAEGLRLYPTNPTAGLRKTGEKAIQVGSFVIPPETTIVAPRWCISRRHDCYVQPEQFIPERWSSRPELILNKAGYTPWGTGQYTCLGRPLAQDLMRLIIARIVVKYDFAFPAGESGENILRDLTDRFVGTPGTLQVKFKIINKV